MANVKFCTICRQSVAKVPVLVQGKLSHYVDAKGRYWNAKSKCPPCANVLRNERKKELKKEKASPKQAEATGEGGPKRFCRHCKNLLPPSRYFHHEECEVNYDEGVHCEDSFSGEFSLSLPGSSRRYAG
jgi:hypothetical protein